MFTMVLLFENVIPHQVYGLYCIVVLLNIYQGHPGLLQHFLTTDHHVGEQAQSECLQRNQESLLSIWATIPSPHDHHTNT